MKKMLCALVLACGLFATQVFAAPQTFNSPAGKFSIDVPQGWTAQTVDMGCMLTDAKGENSMSLQYRKADVDPKVLANAVVESMKGKLVKESEEEGTIVKICTVAGVEVMVVVAPVDDILTCAIIGGPDKQGMLDLLKTVQEVQ